MICNYLNIFMAFLVDELFKFSFFFSCISCCANKMFVGHCRQLQFFNVY